MPLVSADTFVDNSIHWDIVVECLVKLHTKTYEEAFNMVVDYKRRLREAGNEVFLIAHHDEPYNIAYSLAHPGDGPGATQQYNEAYEKNKGAYDEIRDRHYNIG